MFSSNLSLKVCINLSQLDALLHLLYHEPVIAFGQKDTQVKLSKIRCLTPTLNHEPLLLDRRVLRSHYQKFSVRTQDKPNITHNQKQSHKVNDFDFCCVSKCLHIYKSRTKPAGLDFQLGIICNIFFCKRAVHEVLAFLDP